MYFKPNQHVNSERWTLESTISVKESTDNTFFMVLGYQPGGYSGIQQHPGNKRVAIFSLWCYQERDCPTEVSNGEGVKVSRFGGEGTGLKAIKYNFPWKENKDVTFIVEGRLVKHNTWDENFQNSTHQNFYLFLY